MKRFQVTAGAVVGAVVGMVLFSSSSVATESPGPALEMRWNYGSSGSAVLVEPVADGGFVVAGNVKLSGRDDYDACLVKVDGTGSVVWEQVHTGDYYEGASAVQKAADGGYVFVGQAISLDGSQYFQTMLKADADGTFSWQQIYSWDIADWVTEVIAPSEGGYLLVGSKGTYPYGMMVVKTDDAGQVIWRRDYTGGLCGDYCTQINSGTAIVATAGGYFLVGQGVDENQDRGGSNWLQGSTVVVRIDTDGEPLWLRSYINHRGSLLRSLAPSAAVADADGLAITGGTIRVGGDDDFGAFLLSIDAVGNQRWLQEYGSPNYYEEGKALLRMPDSGFLIAGVAALGSANGVYLAKTDVSGTVSWEQTYGNGEQSDFGYAIRMTPEGSYLVAGYTDLNPPSAELDWLVIKTVAPSPQFIRADSNGDNKVDISDAVNTLSFLFLGSGAVSCQDAADANDSGDLDISDAIFTLGFLFSGGVAAPPEPFPLPGTDPTDDALTCERPVPTG